MKKLILTALLICMLIQFVSADVIDPSQKSINHCISIENVEDYSDYVFFLYGSNSGRNLSYYRIIEDGGCAAPGPWFEGIAAIRESYFNEEEIGEGYEGLHNYLNDKLNDNRLGVNKIKLSSGLEVEEYRMVDKDDPLESVEDVFYIKRMNEYGEDIGATSSMFIDIIPLKTTYTYEDGSSEEKAYEISNIKEGNISIEEIRPEPTKKEAENRWLSYLHVLIPIIAFVIILVVIIKKRGR